MINAIVSVASKIDRFFASWQFKKILPVLLVGLLILTTNTGNLDSGVMSKQKAERKVEKMLDSPKGTLRERDDANRPKTTGQWQEQAREVEGDPGERAKRIGEQSADAVKDFGKMYPDVAKRSSQELKKELKDS